MKKKKLFLIVLTVSILNHIRILGPLKFSYIYFRCITSKYMNKIKNYLNKAAKNMVIVNKCPITPFLYAFDKKSGSDAT